VSTEQLLPLLSVAFQSCQIIRHFYPHYIIVQNDKPSKSIAASISNKHWTFLVESADDVNVNDSQCSVQTFEVAQTYDLRDVKTADRTPGRRVSKISLDWRRERWNEWRMAGTHKKPTIPAAPVVTIDVHTAWSLNDLRACRFTIRDGNCRQRSSRLHVQYCRQLYTGGVG